MREPTHTVAPEISVDDYLDRVMAVARLAPADSKRVRIELESHLLALIEAGQLKNLSDEETWIMVRKEFGEPEDLGREIARAKGRFLTYVKREGRKFLISLPIILVLVFSVKAFAVSIYKINTDAVEPYAHPGARVLVNCITPHYAPNDMVVFNEDDPSVYGRTKARWLGPVNVAMIKTVLPNGDVMVTRKGGPDILVAKEALLGRVFLQTR